MYKPRTEHTGTSVSSQERLDGWKVKMRGRERKGQRGTEERRGEREKEREGKGKREERKGKEREKLGPYSQGPHGLWRGQVCKQTIKVRYTMCQGARQRGQNSDAQAAVKEYFREVVS